MKLVLGLDLGVGSVGWALIFITDSGEPIKILALGERIVSMDSNNSNEFSAGATCTLNQRQKVFVRAIPDMSKGGMLLLRS